MKTYLLQKNRLSLILLSIGWLILFFIVGAFSNYPLNDDWVYAKSVELLLCKKEFSLLDYCGSSLAFQILWGSIFCIFGFSFTALRVSVIILGLIGILIFYKIVLKICMNHKISFLATILMAINPLYFLLSGSFMTDVPFVSMLLISLLFYVKTLEKENLTYFIIATFFSILATFTRQIGLILPFCFIFPFLFRNKIRIKPLIYSILSFAIVFFLLKVYLYYLKNLNNLPSFFSGDNTLIDNIFNKPLYDATIGILGFTFLYVGLFSLPISLFLYNKNRRFNLIKLICLSIIIYFIGKTINDLPLGNIINNFYLGPLTLSDFYVIGVNRPIPMNNKIFDFVKVLSILGCILFFSNIFDKITFYKINKNSSEEYNRRIFYTCLIFSFIYLSLLIIANSFFERYLIPIIFIVYIILLLDKPVIKNKFLFIASVIMTSILGIITILGSHDYHLLNKVRWKAANFLEKEKGVARESIDGGYEYNGWYKYDKDYDDSTLFNNWWVENAKYTIAYGSLPGTKTIKKFTYFNWLSLKNHSVKVLEKFDLRNSPIPPLITFDFETISPNGKYLLSNNNRYVFGKADKRSAINAHSGNFSLKFNKNSSRSENLLITGMKQGDYFAVTFWCYSEIPEYPDIFLMIRSDNYFEKIKPIVLESEGNWKLISFETYISLLLPLFNISLEIQNNSCLYIDDLNVFKQNF